MKAGGGKQKGNAFEREICKMLSLWWSGNKRDDVFYRSQSSGGRATQRAKKGQTTSNHYGDVAATDAEGLPFTKFVTVEIKRGYSTSTPYDYIDRLPFTNPSKFEEWVDQAQVEHKKARAKGWWLITKRDRKQTILFMSTDLAIYLGCQSKCCLCLHGLEVLGYYLEHFLEEVIPDDIG